MVCPRCIRSVEDLLAAQQLPVQSVRLGEVALQRPASEKELAEFSRTLQENGFELLDDQKSQQIEKIKNLLIQKVQSGDIDPHFSVSKYLADHLYREYSSLSKLFSGVEGVTIEQFFILQKIEKAKELLMYNEDSLSRIAISLGYSSTQHLSNQFKKITGMTPTQFKQAGALYRRPIDQV